MKRILAILTLAATSLAAQQSQTPLPKLTETIDVKPEKGNLSLNATPWAEVWIDGERVELRDALHRQVDEIVPHVACALGVDCELRHQSGEMRLLVLRSLHYVRDAELGRA